VLPDLIDRMGRILTKKVKDRTPVNARSPLASRADALRTDDALDEILLVHAAFEPYRDRSPNIARIIIKAWNVDRMA
jgi:hypothetical protein